MASLLESIGYNSWVLPALLAIPLIGAVILLLLPVREPAAAEGIETPAARHVALWLFMLEFVVSVGFGCTYHPADSGWQASIDMAWIPTWGVRFTLGIDGIALMMVLLTTFIMPLAVLGSWTSIRTKVRSYYALLLILTTGMIGVFLARDLFLFYVMWEVMLVPMYFIIGIWGGERRIYASLKFFVYTMLPSLLMLVAIIYLGIHVRTATGTPDFSYDHVLAVSNVPERAALWLFAAFFLAFAVKVPMFPFHTWLPDAHVEAPTAGSVILAGIMLKIGGYGFIRFSLPMFPIASSFFTPLIFTLSAIAVIYTSLVALAQIDMKKLIAYSSVAHMGFVTMGTFAVTSEAVQGAMIQMLSHGLVSGALFLCVGVLYDRLHTHEIMRFGGLIERMPAYAFVFMVFSLAAVGLPGTSGFVGEFLILLGTFKVSTIECTLAATALFLGPAYMLYLYRRVIFGTITRADLRGILDLSPREKMVFAPLLVLVLWMGLYPSSFLRPIQVSVDHLVRQVTAATDAAGLRRANLP